MLIKLDTTALRFARQKTQSEEKIVKPLTRVQWINADRIVMAALFIATVACAILF